MVTYADMLTLLLVLFIVLYAISSLNTDKFDQLKASLSNAFGNGQSPVLNGGTGPVDGSSIVQQQQSVSANSINKSESSSQLKVVSTADADAAKKEIDEFSKIEAGDQGLACTSRAWTAPPPSTSISAGWWSPCSPTSWSSPATARCSNRRAS